MTPFWEELQGPLHPGGFRLESFFVLVFELNDDCELLGHQYMSIRYGCMSIFEWCNTLGSKFHCSGGPQVSFEVDLLSTLVIWATVLESFNAFAQSKLIAKLIHQTLALLFSQIGLCCWLLHIWKSGVGSVLGWKNCTAQLLYTEGKSKKEEVVSNDKNTLVLLRVVSN